MALQIKLWLELAKKKNLWLDTIYFHQDLLKVSRKEGFRLEARLKLYTFYDIDSWHPVN